MTALEIPAPDAPAEEWGAFAKSIPGWDTPDSCPLPGFCRRTPNESWKRVKNIEKEAWTNEDVYAWGEGECAPDPDHWSWWRWFITLLGPERLAVWGPTEVASNLGRACIAAAAANGRWPGGAE